MTGFCAALSILYKGYFPPSEKIVGHFAGKTLLFSEKSGIFIADRGALCDQYPARQGPQVLDGGKAYGAEGRGCCGAPVLGRQTNSCRTVASNHAEGYRFNLTSVFAAIAAEFDVPQGAAFPEDALFS